MRASKEDSDSIRALLFRRSLVTTTSVLSESRGGSPVRGIGRWFVRRKPTLYQRCLAVHIAHTGKPSALH